MPQTTVDVGSRIQQAREQRGLTHHDLAMMTKLSTTTLKAIEQNAFGRLPGGMFRVAYIRVVANALKLDPEVLVAAYREASVVEGPAAPAEVVPKTHVFARTSVAVIVSAAVVGASWLSPRDESAPREAPLEVSSTPDATTRPFAVAKAASVASVPARHDTLELELRIKAVCWVSLFADGERLIYSLMQPGERTRVEANDAITLRVGDAGAIAYSINGVVGHSLGGDGEVVTLRITRDGAEGS